MDCKEILWRSQGLYNEELNQFWWWSGSSKINKWAQNTIIVAWPDHVARNDPKALELAFHHQGFTFINAYCQAATNLVD